MRGTWQTTGYGGGGAVLAVVLAAAAIRGVVWAAAHLLEIAATGLACAVLTGLAVRWLIGWSDRHAVRVWSQRTAQRGAPDFSEWEKELKE